jgi:hypothetical protein
MVLVAVALTPTATTPKGPRYPAQFAERGANDPGRQGCCEDGAPASAAAHGEDDEQLIEGD